MRTWTNGLPPLVSLLSAIALTWESVSGLVLPWRLCVILALGLVAQYFISKFIADRMARHARAAKSVASSNPRLPASNRILRSMLVAIMLAVSPAVALGFCYLKIDLFTISVLRIEDNSVQTLRITASYVQVEKVKVRLPRSKCSYSETGGARITEIDPNKGGHTLEIYKLVSPQVVTVKCDEALRLEKRNFSIEDQPQGPYFQTELNTFLVRTFIAGGLIWLIGGLFVLVCLRWFSSRQ